jgi:hypothetical protein
LRKEKWGSWKRGKHQGGDLCNKMGGAKQFFGHGAMAEESMTTVGGQTAGWRRAKWRADQPWTAGAGSKFLVSGMIGPRDVEQKWRADQSYGWNHDKRKSGRDWYIEFLTQTAIVGRHMTSCPFSTPWLAVLHQFVSVATCSSVYFLFRSRRTYNRSEECGRPWNHCVRCKWILYTNKHSNDDVPWCHATVVCVLNPEPQVWDPNSLPLEVPATRSVTHICLRQ